MISLSQLLKEATAIFEKDAEQLVASKVAKKLGLVYKGFGRWADPKTNKIVAKTISGKLVKVAPEDQEDSEQPGGKKGVASKYTSGAGMRQAANKLDAPSGVPFGKEDKFKNRRQTLSKIDDYLTKNKDRIAGNPQAEAKATALVKKVQLSQGLSPDDAEYIDAIAADEGFEGVLKANRLIDDTLTKDGGFQVEFDYLDRPASREHPDEYASATKDFDTLEDVYNAVTWRTDPRTGQETWDFEPEAPEPDYDRYDDRDY